MLGILPRTSLSGRKARAASSSMLPPRFPEGPAGEGASRRFFQQPPPGKRLRRSLRLHQWAKNALVFVPLVLGGKAMDTSAWTMAALGFIALGLAASATYVVNDLWDLPNDRRHWSKRFRPLASGELSIREATYLAASGLAVAFAIAATIGNAALAMLALYAAGTLSYSFFLKRVPILDVLVLGALYTFRLGFGIVLANVLLSPWILVFSMFVFGSLSMAKRHTEVLRLAERGIDAMPGRGYIASDAPLTLGVGLASMLGAILIMVLYLIEDAFPRGFYASPAFLWAIPPILFLFLGRVWLVESARFASRRPGRVCPERPAKPPARQHDGPFLCRGPVYPESTFVDLARGIFECTNRLARKAQSFAVRLAWFYCCAGLRRHHLHDVKRIPLRNRTKCISPANCCKLVRRTPVCKRHLYTILALLFLRPLAVAWGSDRWIDPYWLFLILACFPAFYPLPASLPVHRSWESWRKERAFLAALLSATLLLRGGAVGSGGLFLNYFTHSEVANGLFLIALYFSIRGGIAASIGLTGVTFFVNAFMGAWTATVVGVIILIRILRGMSRCLTQ